MDIEDKSVVGMVAVNLTLGRIIRSYRVLGSTRVDTGKEVLVSIKGLVVVVLDLTEHAFS
jgi:hypothetical protein